MSFKPHLYVGLFLLCTPALGEAKPIKIKFDRIYRQVTGHIERSCLALVANDIYRARTAASERSRVEALTIDNGSKIRVWGAPSILLESYEVTKYSVAKEETYVKIQGELRTGIIHHLPYMEKGYLVIPKPYQTVPLYLDDYPTETKINVEAYTNCLARSLDIKNLKINFRPYFELPPTKFTFHPDGTVEVTERWKDKGSVSSNPSHGPVPIHPGMEAELAQ